MPAQFDGRSLSEFASTVLARLQEHPSALAFDFAPLDFIRPTGVVFLSNLIDWLDVKGAKVSFLNCDVGKEAVRYLDDSLFFAHHRGSKLSAGSEPHGSKVTIYSGAGIVAFEWEDGILQSRVLEDAAFCPGTTIEIEVRTSAIERVPEDREDLQW